MRLFVALVPPAHVVASLPPLPRGLRAVPPYQVHLTLAFLGELGSSDPVATSLDRAVSGAAPVLRLAGAGAFGRAVWLGVHGDRSRLAELAASVQDAVQAAGVELEPRRWRPHLTVGRTRTHSAAGAQGTRQLLAELDGYAGPSAAWTEVRLVRSHLGRDGARHETLVLWHLEDGTDSTS